MNTLAELYRYFDKHRIYLPSEICGKLDKLVRDVRELVINFGVYLDFDDHSLNEHTYKEKQKAWHDGWKTIQQQIPLARQALEDEFRRLLGAAL